MVRVYVLNKLLICACLCVCVLHRQFQQQFELVKSLSHLEGVVKVLALEKYQNSLLLVFEDTGGVSIHDWRRQSAPAPSLRERVLVAIKV